MKKFFKWVLAIILIILITIAVLMVGSKKYNFFESKTIEIGFEDIGELVTQSAYCTEVSVSENSRQLFGATIPFTKSKQMYSYDVVIKAGYDFNEITWKANESTIEVKLPEPKVMSNEIDMESFKVYHEDESIFSPITLDDNNDALKELKETAQKDAIEKGLLENARSNAEKILTSFFGNTYDLKKYQIVFTDK
ncbi:hypothetical protein M2454_002283 [Aequitasia blattaphilus]|uniref:DUF4230 domain-containing protein n=1 Tax=Aequitasia blattaphilus TaxID=2949332 RepID=A0ABT1EC67_9FIRM|nr:DUF4230 domain-containing protein [Aequitasia blattaphilus]MCP1103430.1 DUF4230 domain-containing protein [Aequitasia blattaphilus]MCR8616070.1 DUF4230 domain-containing protein [Aequitasia blattaphilus]